MEKKKIKARKKAYKKALRKARRPWKFLTLLTGPFAAILIAAFVVCSIFDNTIALFTGGTFWELENRDDSAIYYKGDFATEAERLAKGAELVKQVEAEGAALLINETNTLPLASGAKVRLLFRISCTLLMTSNENASIRREGKEIFTPSFSNVSIK